jgi:hypothetical protein
MRYDFITYVDYDGKTKSAVVPREVLRRAVNPPKMGANNDHQDQLPDVREEEGRKEQDCLRHW